MATTSDRRSTAGAGFSEQERAAMQERASELRKQAKTGRGNKSAADQADVLARIAEMPAEDRALAERVHALVTRVAPDLAPRLYYGQPAWARKGKVVCFFRSGRMDKERYSTFGFSADAHLDDDSGLWPTAYALTALDDDAWERLARLVERAAS